MFTKVFESDFSTKSLQELSDEWLSIFHNYAVELQCSKYIKAVNAEITRRKAE